MKSPQCGDWRFVDAAGADVTDAFTLTRLVGVEMEIRAHKPVMLARIEVYDPIGTGSGWFTLWSSDGLRFGAADTLHLSPHL